MSVVRFRLAVAAVLSGVLVGTTAAAQSPAVSAPVSGPAAAVEEGRNLFQARCGMCHLEGGTGTFMLGRRLGSANALLAERTNLDATYVKHVVRNGIVSMPRITRAEVTDAELQAIVNYLVAKNDAHEQSPRKQSTPGQSIPEARTPQLSTPGQSIPEVGTPQLSAREQGIPEVGTPQLSAREQGIPGRGASGARTRNGGSEAN